jgi:hypothetical protein
MIANVSIRDRLEADKIAYDGRLEILPGIFSIYVMDPNDIRLEFSCQPGNGEGEPLIVPLVTQSKTQALQELRSLSSDQKWLAEAVADLAN